MLSDLGRCVSVLVGALRKEAFDKDNEQAQRVHQRMIAILHHLKVLLMKYVCFSAQRLHCVAVKRRNLPIVHGGAEQRGLRVSRRASRQLSSATSLCYPLFYRVRDYT